MRNKFGLLVLGLALGVILSAVVPCALYSQEITGNISGTVTDPSGAVIPEANVVVTNVRTSAARSTTTTSAGVFFFTSLPVGDYKLSVEKAGFKKYGTTAIRLDVNAKLDFPVVLQVGAVTESVTVTGEAAVLQTETAEVSNLISATQTQDLPLNGRVFNQLVDLVPGVAPDSGRVANGVGLFSDTAVSVNGNQSNSNLYLVNGQYDEDNGSNANLLVTPSVESIEEFKILRNNYSAEFGEATGAIINVVTKSGGKDFHGSLFEFLRNNALDANDFFLNSSNTPKSPHRLNNFGFTAGGPFWIPGKYNTDRSKDFFFVSTEWRRETQGNVVTDTVPTARQKTLGILDPTCAVTPAPCTPQPADPSENPLTGEANIDPSTIDPNSAALLARVPLPTPGVNFGVSGFNWIASEPTITNVNQQSVRWDHNVGDKATVMVNYMAMNQALGGINTQLWGDDSFPSVNSDWTWTGKIAALKLTNMISPRTVNDFQFGYSNNAITFKTGKTSDPTLASRAGFTYLELFPQTSGSFPTLPSPGPDGFFGNGIQHTAPFFNRTDNYQLKDDVSHTIGKHNFKAGGYFRWMRKREPANGGDNETAGTLTFSSFQDLLLGNLANYTEEETLNEVPDRARDAAFYFQDTYKALPTLTLDYGLRWQYLGQIFSQHNNIANFWPNRYNPSLCSAAAIDPATGLVDPTKCNVLNGIVTPGSSGVPRALERAHYNDWEPRFGLAWDPRGNHKFIVRGGVGIYHGRDAVSQTSSLGRQPPFDIIASLNNLTFKDLAPGGLSPFNPATPQPPAILQALDPIYFNPQSYQYSFGFQYEFMRETSVEINYVGSHQIHLARNRDINQVPLQDQAEIYSCTQGITVPIPSIGLPACPASGFTADQVRPFLGFANINVNERAAVSRYNSLQVYLNRQLRRGLQFQAAYTYGKTLTNTHNNDTEGREQPVLNGNHPNLEWAPAIQDQTHSLVFNYIWQVPFFNGAAGYRKALLGGWELVGISVFRSGLPNNVCLDHDLAGIANGDICQRPDLVAGQSVNLPKSRRTLGEYFNTSAFVLPLPGTFGNAARNMIRGPGVNNWDFSIFKNFEIPWFGKHSGWAASETARVQFRAEFFNMFNHAQFNSLNTTFVPLNTCPQAALGSDCPRAPVDPSSGFGSVSGDRDPRNIQFALKIMF